MFIRHDSADFNQIITVTLNINNRDIKLNLFHISSPILRVYLCQDRAARYSIFVGIGIYRKFTLC